jgi:hypothetical protein
MLGRCEVMSPPDDIPGETPSSQIGQPDKVPAVKPTRSVGPESEDRGGPEAPDDSLDEKRP